MNTRSIDLNADLGEGYAHDAALMQIVTSANICSGAYIMDDAPVKAALKLAKLHNVRVGIHVGYPDVEGFGRRTKFMSPSAFKASLDEQVDSFLVLAKAAGVEVKYLKPHGALYHDLIPKSELWTNLLRVCAKHNWDVVHLAGSDFLKLARIGIGGIQEGFVDRKYQSAHHLFSRKHEGAVLTSVSEVIAQAKSLANGRLTLDDARVVPIEVNSLCLHGDTPGAVELGRKVRAGLLAEHFRIAPYERVTVLPYGPKACIIRVNEASSYALTKLLWLAAAGIKTLPSINETRISYNEILVQSDEYIDLKNIFEKSEKALQLPNSIIFERGSINHIIRTTYAGDDMEFVIQATGLTRAEIIKLHTQQKFTVHALGFQPGFAFLGTLPLALQLPRRSVPRKRVPPNSVAIAADQTAIYPHASPGGWHLIGIAENPVFDIESENLSILQPGDTVQFIDATEV